LGLDAQESASMVQGPSVTSHIGGVVVVVIVMEVVVVMVVVGVVVVVGDIVSEGQSFHPSSCAEPSEAHVIGPLGVTPSGPLVPEYLTPFTTSSSYDSSVLKLCCKMGTAIDASTAIVHASFAPYFEG